MIPIHPQPVAGHPEQLRWIAPAGVLPFTGVAATLPAPLAALRDDGTLAEVRVEPAAIVTTLHPGPRWSRETAPASVRLCTPPSKTGRVGPSGPRRPAGRRATT
ncbi:hypothetical protein [Micromonospora sp. AKA38]|uniref:hypothetical protein n=1 Tax=Micromonospora sp. AKA38 TaxID=2733861 RepID=UPI0022BE5B92|nr:hypothetical protein [Micromonospora sp. AKA38]GHJ16027.1 hypothetical protein TPA0908_40220 [Micromonospora sp. AKA38]